MHSPQVRELINKVRAVFVETLDELGWMDEASKKKAQEKVGGWSPKDFPPGEGSPSVGSRGDRQHTRFTEEDTEAGCGSPRKRLWAEAGPEANCGRPPRSTPGNRCGWPWPRSRSPTGPV